MTSRRRKTGFGAMLHAQCPRCREGQIFISKKAYQWKQITTMPDACPVCGEDFLREPGFYFGAAYVSYALTIALWVAVLVALMCFDWWGLIEFSFFEDVTLFLSTGITLLLVLLPLIARLSRSMWLHMMTRRRRR
ncbi:MAG: DUF983 domain-containing protein [Crocinitomicaceae bacterium]|jgi:uncharacterized protein (DUF983 family)|nr:DUF983 domain-containing protein [Crocinitomicaceae bacterium]|tara:strand:- start:1547 stop:1951 length:405 start_codon:yes stop_codon:yes gene_type:complete